MQTFARGLTEKGHEVFYCTQGDWETLDFKRFERWQNWLRYGFNVLGLSTELIEAWAERIVQAGVAFRVARQFEPSHIWFQDPWLAWAYKWIHRGLSGKKVVWGVSEHGYGSFARAVQFDGIKLNSRTVQWLFWLERRVLMQADWVWSPSQSALGALYADLGVFVHQTHWDTLSYGCPAPIKWHRRQARELLGWDQDQLYVLSIGRIAPVKRMEVVVRACAEAQRGLSQPVQLVILGEGQEALVQEVARESQLRLPPIISLVNDISPFLAAADVYVSASDAESFGLANQEAIAAGLPCLLRCGGATCEVSGVGAWVVGSDEALVQGLLELLQSSALRTQWRQLAKIQLKNWQSWESIIDLCERRLLEI